MLGLLVILGTIYLVGALLWAVNYAMDWSDSKGGNGYQNPERARVAARNFLSTPIWPLIVLNNTVSMIKEMRERV